MLIMERSSDSDLRPLPCMGVISLAIVLDLNINFFYLIAAEQIHGFGVLGGREKKLWFQKIFWGTAPIAIF